MHIDEARGILANLIAQGAAYIIQALGYTPANKAGDTFTGASALLQSNGGGVVAAVADFNTTAVGTRPNFVWQLANPAVKLGVGYIAADLPVIQGFDTTVAARDLVLQPFGGNIGVGITPTGPYKLEVAGALSVASNTLIRTSVAFTNGAAAAAGTLLNAPTAGNPTKWIPVNDNGTTRYIPAW